MRARRVQSEVKMRKLFCEGESMRGRASSWYQCATFEGRMSGQWLG